MHKCVECGQGTKHVQQQEQGTRCQFVIYRHCLASSVKMDGHKDEIIADERDELTKMKELVKQLLKKLIEARERENRILEENAKLMSAFKNNLVGDGKSSSISDNIGSDSGVDCNTDSSEDGSDSDFDCKSEGGGSCSGDKGSGSDDRCSEIDYRGSGTSYNDDDCYSSYEDVVGGVHYNDDNDGASYKHGGDGAKSHNNSGSGAGDGELHQQQQKLGQSQTQLQQQFYQAYNGDVGSQKEHWEAECFSKSAGMVEMVTDGVSQQEIPLYSLQVVCGGD